MDLTPPSISYTALGNTTSTSNRTLTATITDATGVPTAGAGLPVIYYRKGTSDPFVSTQGSFVSGNTYSFTLNYSLVTGGSVTVGDTIQYYVVAQDTAATPNVGSNPSAGASGFTANPPAASTPPTTPNSYMIQGSIAGNFTVGAAGTYTTLTAGRGRLEQQSSHRPGRLHAPGCEQHGRPIRKTRAKYSRSSSMPTLARARPTPSRSSRPPA